jgi:putative transposase
MNAPDLIAQGFAFLVVISDEGWRSVKYEEVYLRAYANGTEARVSLQKYFAFYNARRLHENLNYATPDEVYYAHLAASMPAAA